MSVFEYCGYVAYFLPNRSVRDGRERGKKKRLGKVSYQNRKTPCPGQHKAVQRVSHC